MSHKTPNRIDELMAELDSAWALVETILMLSRDGLIILGGDGQIEKANRVAAALLGAEDEPLTGKTLSAVLVTGRDALGVELEGDATGIHGDSLCHKRVLVHARHKDGADSALWLTSRGTGIVDDPRSVCMLERVRYGDNVGLQAAEDKNGSTRMDELRTLGGEDLIEELLSEFRVQVKSDLAEIEAAADASDHSEVARLAHRLKGGSITVGLTSVAEKCADLETAAIAGDATQVMMLCQLLDQEIERLQSVSGDRDSMERPVRILIADDHPVVRFGVRRMLQSHSAHIVIGEASDGREAIRQLQELQPDILLLDLNMPMLPGLETLRELTAIQVETRTILLTSSITQREILEALQLGARGVVVKDALTTDLTACIAAVMEGHYWLGRRPVHNLVQVLNELMEEIKQPPPNTFGLTARELDIVRLIAQGLTNKDIARECGIAEETVKRHLKNIFDKVGVWSRLELALFAINNRLVTDISENG